MTDMTLNQLSDGWYNSRMNNPTQYDVVLEPQPGGGYAVYVPDLPGCVSEGRTRAEALTMIADAINGYLAVRKERGWKLPKVEHRQVTLA